MQIIEQLAAAALQGDCLTLRSLWQDVLQDASSISTYPQPATNDPCLLAASASLVELLAERSHQPPPAWTQEIGPMPEPTFLVPSAKYMKHLRILCETQSPEPLRRRYLYAPPNFLELA